MIGYCTSLHSVSGHLFPHVSFRKCLIQSTGLKFMPSSWAVPSPIVFLLKIWDRYLVHHQGVTCAKSCKWKNQNDKHLTWPWLISIKLSKNTHAINHLQHWFCMVSPDPCTFMAQNAMYEVLPAKGCLPIVRDVVHPPCSLSSHGETIRKRALESATPVVFGLLPRIGRQLGCWEVIKKHPCFSISNVQPGIHGGGDNFQ